MVFAALTLYSSLSRFLSSVPPTRAPSSILFSQQLSPRNHHLHCLCPPHPICLSSDTGSVRTFPSYPGEVKNPSLYKALVACTSDLAVSKMHVNTCLKSIIPLTVHRMDTTTTHTVLSTKPGAQVLKKPCALNAPFQN